MKEDTDDFGVNSIPQLRKVQGSIPIQLYEELQRRGLFSATWDSWLASAILAKLKEKNLED